MDCRCNDLCEISGDDALAYREHMVQMSEERGAWLLRCPLTGREWIEDFPLDPQEQEWVGRCRLRRLPIERVE
jgi:hypothetical protein